ncbi:P13 [Clanis bilineata nucleopolyhedrovirus]|uniref:p13 n=1 Tax=Clanis bilineata nucleopolyhedrovirus TaxID=1307957 RepID=Q0N408_9ABAC|nr:P13 [Clanis bilineata nucleopolyhedrovirus]ABF47435.1 P13 [Clanis bilineata nucleopolyhedrovirus]
MFAYVTLVMLGDEYVEGAIVLSKSIAATGSTHDRVCMVTKDVSTAARRRLQNNFNVVIEVEYAYYQCPPMLTKRQNEMYGKWIDYAFTKWHCLTLSAYKKIVYLDADHLVVKNIDHLFQLPAPAMCFTDENYGYYDKLLFGQTLTPRTLSLFMKHNKILCKGGTVVFSPNAVLHSTIMSLINSNNKYLVQHSRYHNGFDEQVLMQALIQLNISVTQLSVLYVWNAGSYHRLSKNIEPFIINYYGDNKPWTFNDDSRVNYMDIFLWKYFSLKTDCLSNFNT